MSKYFIDTEFLEGTQKEKFPINLFRKSTPPTIDLISIGIVSEDGREYYAISKDFNLKEAWNRFDLKEVKTNNTGDIRDYTSSKVKEYWIRENVLKNLFNNNKFGHYEEIETFTQFKNLVNHFGKSREEIAEEVKNYVNCKQYMFNQDNVLVGRTFIKQPVSFYAYFADYDWVAFCWLFGKMLDLPKEFPKYCRDLKQEFDDLILSNLTNLEFWKRNQYTGCPNNFEHGLNMIKKGNPDYPRQTNEHNALADARWNKELHKFIKSL
jgi:hypothetical protein